MDKLSWWQLIPLAFYSQDAYRFVYWKWKVSGVLYLLVLVAIACTLSVTRAQIGFIKWANEEAVFYANQIPKITIQNGEASTDVETPYLIKDETGEVAAIIDLTGELKSVDETNARVLLTKTDVSVKKDARETRTYQLAEIRIKEVDKTRILGWVDTAKFWFIPVVYPLIVLFGFIFRLAQVLIYSLVTMAFIPRAQRTYLRVFRLTAVAVTPIILIDAVVGFFSIEIPAWWFAGILIAVGYIFFAAKSIPETPPKPEATPPVA
jgi:hypothetical protein